MLKFYILFIYLFFTLSLVESRTILSKNDSIALSQYYTKDELSYIQKRIIDLKRNKKWDKTFLGKIKLDPMMNKYEFKDTLGIYRTLDNSNFSSLSSREVLSYPSWMTFIKNEYIITDPNQFEIINIHSYTYKKKIKKEDFLSLSFLSNLKIPSIKLNPWIISILIKDQSNDRIESTDLAYLYSTKKNMYTIFFNAKDSLSINSFFTIDKIPQTKFGVSENKNIYVFQLSGQQEKWILGNFEEYIINNPKIFK